MLPTYIYCLYAPTAAVLMPYTYTRVQWFVHKAILMAYDAPASVLCA